MILINILFVLLTFLILSDLYIKNSPKSKLNLVPINYKIKKKDGLNELIIDLKITNTSKTKETMVSNINFELDFFKSKGNEYCQNLNYQEDIYIYENNKGSILRTIIYTIGHFAIAITVLMLIAEVSFMVALTDAIVEPLANAIWYFVLDKIWTSKYKK